MKTSITSIISLIISLTITTTPIIVGMAQQKTSVKNDVCEYDIDLKENTFHARCQGQPLGVSVFANSASVNTGQVSNRGMYPSVQPSVNVLQSPFGVFRPSLKADNTTTLLNTMKEKLGSQKSAISNISHLLSRGDNDLRSDLQALRGLASDESSVRESIIATMRNQYNFMRTAILAHNTELNHVLSLLESLVGLTSQTRHQALYTQQTLNQQLLHVNRTMLAMRTTFSSCLKKCHRKKEPRKKNQCPRAVSAFGRGTMLPGPWDKGVVMTDSFAEHSDKMWVMAAQDSRDLVRQYDYREDIQYNVVGRYISLPFFCEGTGHVVYRNALYCHKSGSRTITRYSLKRMSEAAEVELPTAGVANTFPYQFGLYSDIDLAVDELGLWVIYSTKESAGKMVISKLHPRTLAIETTWLTSFPKRMVGNSFMICGVLYATNSYQDTPTYIRYIYNTNTQQEAKMDAGNLPFNNAVTFNSSHQAHSVMLQYSPNDHTLYSWSRGQIQMFPVYFKKD